MSSKFQHAVGEQIERFRELTDESLRFIIKDAGEAAQNMRGFDDEAEGKYLDQINDACTVLRERRLEREAQS